MNRKDFKIDLSVDKEARTLTVSDNGIGMDKEDLENNLGVIASSGSYKFKQEVGEDSQGHRHHRPVRRRLLLCLHGQRSGHGRHPALRQRHGLSVAVLRRRRLHHHRM